MSLRHRAGLIVLALCAATAAVSTGSTGAQAAVVVPTGMTDNLIASIPLPTSIGRASDGRTFVTGKDGSLWMIDAAGVKQPTPLITFSDICANSERGLLGVAADPAIASNGYIFLYATRTIGGTCLNRVSRFTVSGAQGAVVAGSELVLIDRIPSPNGNHNGGDLKFGKDGLLYVTVGDGGCAVFDRAKCAGANPAAQRSDLLSGKILRIASDGSIPAGNMFGAGSVRCGGLLTGVSAGGASCSEIYALGLRNPFRLVPDLVASGTKFVINDVGQDAQEEVDLLVPGGNYGWNSWEGRCPTGQTYPCSASGTAPAGFLGPLYAYNHAPSPSGECGVITAGALPPDGWTGRVGRTYLYADYGCSTVFEVSDLGGVNTVTTFATGTGPVIDMQMVHETGGWSMYYATFANGGEIHRLRPASTISLPGTGRYVPISQVRVLDSRNNIGTTLGKPKAGSVTTFTIPTSAVPPNATAVSVNITGVAPGGAGFVTAWPAWTTMPNISNLNFAYAGETDANAAVLPIGAGGEINLATSTSAHLLVDITGYWLPATAATGGRFLAVDPSRILDTRNGIGAPAGAVAAHGEVSLQVNGQGGVPSSGVSAVAMVVTSVSAVGPGYVTVWRADQTIPEASSINPMGGDVRANLVIVPVSPDGKVRLFTSSSAHLLVDVSGYFTDGSASSSSAGLLQVVAPNRLVDTRNTHTPMTAGETRSLTVPVAPTGVRPSAVLYNLTAVATGASGFMTAFPSDRTRPEASNVNFEAPGQTRAALAITRTPSPTINLYSFAPADVLIDTQAYFT
jgi:glucose/arabinose dehydrogenase